MKIKDYIIGKFQPFGINLSEADLLDISLNSRVDLDINLSVDNKKTVEIAMCKFIPTLLLRPQSISEGGVSVSYDSDSIKEYYSFLCKRYSLVNHLNPKPKIIFK